MSTASEVSPPPCGIAYRGELRATICSRMYATASELSGSGMVLWLVAATMFVPELSSSFASTVSPSAS